MVEIVQFLKCCSLQNQKIKCTLIQRVPHCTTTSSLINATLCRQLNSSKNYDNVGASPDVFKLFVLFWPPKTLTPPEIVKFANLSHQWKLGSKITCKHATNNSTIQISHLLTHDHNWGGSKKSSNSQILNSISINFSVKQKPTKNLLKALKFNWYLTFVNVSS